MMRLFLNCSFYHSSQVQIEEGLKSLNSVQLLWPQSHYRVYYDTVIITHLRVKDSVGETPAAAEMNFEIGLILLPI